MSEQGEAGGPVVEPARALAGDADGFERLWVPHRAAYVSGEERPAAGATGEQCPFCRAPTREDRDALVVARGEWNYVVLNLYPYNPGHMLVTPYRHVSDYTDLTAGEREEFSAMTARAIRALRRASNPGGLNIGMNQGEVAGAGIAAHLHQHIVPRWLGDANFFPIVARTKALPEVLSATREKLAEAWAQVGEAGAGSQGHVAPGGAGAADGEPVEEPLVERGL